MDRSGYNLEIFYLTGSLGGDGELITILKHLPSSLTHLFLLPSPFTKPWLTKEVWDLFKSARNLRDASEDCFFPNLELFHYRGRQTSLWPDMIGAFYSPSASSGNHRLRTLDIGVHRNKDFKLTPIRNPSTVLIIHELQRSGFNISTDTICHKTSFPYSIIGIDDDTLPSPYA
ncbi:hypothetical protein M413DRAFT_247843 [Hebeloma cylindrosporum]|uniref:Uncharacterized protein n=1 Tax=Hebeloma cylindrosporum TaxID=76867 RepID=A0A0C3C1T2_HEBCY|nr:hypothetical protein M413DRAFT_247843 [Hebeloma cylindrosporum h7]